MDSTHYLCEYLPRLGRINAIIESIAVNDIVDVKSKGNRATLGNLSIELPIMTSEQVTKLQKKQNSFIFSLEAPRTTETYDAIAQDQYPWTANEITQGNGTLKCLKCDNTIIPIDQIAKVHPMPSELWAEMMEFWHCHKPQEGEQYLSAKISQRFNTFEPKPKNVIIGSFYFIINPIDWKLANDLECKCGEILGQYDENYSNYKLFKWKLRWNERVFDPCKLVTLKLMDEINSTAVRFYILKCKKRDPILLWCFNVGLGVSINDFVYSNCMKLLYKTDPAEVDQFIQDQDLISLHKYNVIDVEWCENFDDFVSKLQLCNKKLPFDQKMFNGWNIGYLN